MGEQSRKLEKFLEQFEGDFMEAREAIDFLNGVIKEGFPAGGTVFPIDEKKKEVMKTAISALEKQIPKKPYDESKVKMTWYSECTCCKKQIPYVVWQNNMNYCPNCGQAFDWSEQQEDLEVVGSDGESSRN